MELVNKGKVPDYGGVPEWLNGAVSKTVVRESVPWVQIPPPPPTVDEFKEFV